MNYYEHHVGDYDKNTAHLSACEDGIYCRLLRRYYDKEMALECDVEKIKRWARARTEEERAAVEVILAEFFHLEESGWHHDKADEIIAAYRATEPERQARKVNEDTRLARHRRERADLFSELNAAGEHAPFNIAISDLRSMVERVRSVSSSVSTGAQAVNNKTSVISAATAPATGRETPATAPATGTATLATATQAPLPIPNIKEKEDRTPSGVSSLPKSAKVTFTTWHDSLPEGVDAIPRNHAVFRYADEAEIPREFLRLAWLWFSRKYGECEKKYTSTGWPRVFQQAVEGNWGKLWWIEPDGGYRLTTVGLQLQRVTAQDEAA